MIEWIVANDLGDLASVLGLAISLVGFAATLWNVARSRSAAERAEEAAKEARARFRLFDSIAALAEAVTTMEHIKRLHRDRAWTEALDGYGTVARLLRQVKGGHHDLSHGEESAIQAAHADLLIFEQKVEVSLRSEEGPDEFDQFNHILSRHIYRIDEILIAMKQRTGR